ncbi:MAG: PorV/PorQ family protein [Odoribacteraceae bacterium]|jgi:hypothetical protein|nr:PorV/PorQ family protein [Odoribacteraceae bacterium]
MKQKIPLSCLFLLGTLLVSAQSVSFLEITPAARAASLGGIATATVPGAGDAGENIAKFASRPLPGAFVYTYAPGINKTFPGSQMHAAAARYPLSATSTLTTAFKRVSLGEIQVEHVDGVSRMKPVDIAVDLGYARLLARGLSAGVSVRYISSDLDEEGVRVARGLAWNVSAYYRRPLALLGGRAAWTVGVVAANIGPGISYGTGERNALPARLNAGAAIQLPFNEEHDLRCAVEYGCRLAPRKARAPAAMMAIEHVFYERYALRVGYHRGDTGKGGARFLSAGCGIHLHRLSVDLSYQKTTGGPKAMDQIPRVSVGVELGRPRE